MLRELNVVEQRYQAVLEVLDGTPVTEVAQRFGVARQTVHRWVARYRESGLDGLADRSHAPQAHPWRVSAEIEAVICDLRTAHRSWVRAAWLASAKRPGRVQRSHDDTGEHDHMADTILTESEASLAVEDLGWRYLLDCLTTAVTVDSLFDACEVIRAAVDIAGPHANDHLRLRATADRVE